jgi:hypothetical protein
MLKRIGGVVQVVECLHEAMNSDPSTIKKKVLEIIELKRKKAGIRTKIFCLLVPVRLYGKI